MTTSVVTIGSAESIHTAATLMKDHSIRRLPVVGADNLVGILTTTNLTHYLPLACETLSFAIETSVPDNNKPGISEC